MVTERKISLIGGRSSIPGVFHGPLYYWLVSPFFALSGGNPAAVSIAWLLLYWLFLGSFYYVAKKTFKDKLHSLQLLLSSYLSLILLLPPTIIKILGPTKITGKLNKSKLTDYLMKLGLTLQQLLIAIPLENFS